MKIKKVYIILVLILLLFSSCINQSIVYSKSSNTNTNEQANITYKSKPIPFQYLFTGFVSVNDVYNDLPVGTQVFNTEEEWTKFKNKYLYSEDIPYPGYSGGINFEKESVVYYSILDAKADVYAMAHQIDTITISNHQIDIIPKNIDGNLNITATNTEKFGGQRYVIILSINKVYLKDVR